MPIFTSMVKMKSFNLLSALVLKRGVLDY